MAGTGSSQLWVPIPSRVHPSRRDKPPRPVTKSHLRGAGGPWAARTQTYTHTCTPIRAYTCRDVHAHSLTHMLGSPLLRPPSHHHRPHYGGRCEQLRRPPLPLLSPGLPEEQWADVCSVTICILLDSIIISITPSFHPRSSVFSGNRDGWSLYTASRRGGGGSQAAILGTLSLVTDGEVTGN